MWKSPVEVPTVPTGDLRLSMTIGRMKNATSRYTMFVVVVNIPCRTMSMMPLLLPLWIRFKTNDMTARTID